MSHYKDPRKVIVVQSLRGITPEQETPDIVKSAKNQLSKSAIAGEATYMTSCLVCHRSGIESAPEISNKEIWSKRLE